MSSIKIGDRVRVKASLQKGMGVCGEQLSYVGTVTENSPMAT